MSEWGLFKDPANSEVAVGPIARGGKTILPPHTTPFDRNCPCRPTVEAVPYGEMIVHNDPARGGCDA